jgi:hypothetical protein
MEKLATAPVEQSTESPSIEESEIRSLQTYYEGNCVYVVTYYMDDRIMIKMYEKSGGSNSMYHYMGMIEHTA